MNKKVFLLLAGLILAGGTVRADVSAFSQHYDAGQIYLSQFQYASAISEFKMAMRINYLDNSARIGLINSYLARATYYANKEQSYEKAANDLRAAIFYLRYWANPQTIQNSSAQISSAVENLNLCLTALKYDTTPKSRLAKAQALRAQGFFAEAGYEFIQASSGSDNSVKTKALEQAGDMMKVLRNEPKALEYYQKAVALNEGNGALRLKYARSLDNQGQNDAAVVEYNYALSKSEGDFEILYALEKIYLQKLANTPNDAETNANLGAIYQKQNKLDEAMKYYSKAEVINPTNVTTRLNLGTLFQQQKNYDKALEAYDSVLVLYPSNKQANLYKAQVLSLMGESEKSIEQFKKVLNIDPTNQDAKLEMIKAMQKTLTSQELLSYIKRDFADNASICYDLGLEFHKQGRYDDAIMFYQETLKTNKTNPEIYLNLALAYKDKNDMAKSTAVLKQAKALFPSNQQILAKLKEIDDLAVNEKYAQALDLFNKNEYQKALDIYLTITPPDEDLYLAIASCYQGLNDDKNALTYYQKAFTANPKNADVAYYLGVLYSEQENWTSAKTYLKKTLAIDKTNQKALDLYASVMEQANIKTLDKAIEFYEKANYVEALKLVNQILAEDVKNTYAFYYRGMIYDAQKKPSPAIADYQKALTFNKDLIICHYLLAVDYDTLSQFKNALNSYKKFVALTEEDNDYKKYSASRIKALKSYE